MGKIISIILAAVIFYIIYYMLVPLLPDGAEHFVGTLVVIAAILYLLGEVASVWPWSKK